MHILEESVVLLQQLDEFISELLDVLFREVKKKHIAHDVEYLVEDCCLLGFSQLVPVRS